MRIVKLIHQVFSNSAYSEERYDVIFDEIPSVTYEQVGANFVGSVVDNQGRVIFSNVLKRESWAGAFGGRELCLEMKDGTQKKIKDYWYDCGSYADHGDFVDIGGGTLEKLQDCFVFCGMNINKQVFEDMVDEYLRFDRTYTHIELKEWCRLQYEWFPVYIGKNRLPLMVNKMGDFVTPSAKEPVFPRTNYLKSIRGVCFNLCYFSYSYHNGDRLVKYTNTVLQVLEDSLPCTEDEIIKNAKINLGKSNGIPMK